MRRRVPRAGAMAVAPDWGPLAAVRRCCGSAASSSPASGRPAVRRRAARRHRPASPSTSTPASCSAPRGPRRSSSAPSRSSARHVAAPPCPGGPVRPAALIGAGSGLLLVLEPRFPWSAKGVLPTLTVIPPSSAASGAASTCPACGTSCRRRWPVRRCAASAGGDRPAGPAAAGPLARRRGPPRHRDRRVLAGRRGVRLGGAGHGLRRRQRRRGTADRPGPAPRPRRARRRRPGRRPARGVRPLGLGPDRHRRRMPGGPRHRRDRRSPVPGVRILVAALVALAIGTPTLLRLLREPARTLAVGCEAARSSARRCPRIPARASRGPARRSPRPRAPGAARP